MTLNARIRAERLLVGERFSVSFQRTQRIAESLHVVQSPPSWGALPVHSISDEKNVFLIPVGRDEAVWLGFAAAAWKPNAIKVGVAGRNAVTGEKWDTKLRASPQNYMVCPPQLALEGMRTENGSTCQIVPVAEGESEANLISLIVYEPKKGNFPEERPTPAADKTNVLHSFRDVSDDKSGAESLGQRIARQVHSDRFGIDTWDKDPTAYCYVYMVDHERYQEITGQKPPPATSPSDIYQGNVLP